VEEIGGTEVKEIACFVAAMALTAARRPMRDARSGAWFRADSRARKLSSREKRGPGLFVDLSHNSGTGAALASV
jgi:hypothetical protein